MDTTKNNTIKKEFKSNIELMRIFAMIIIIANHAINHEITKRKDIWKQKNKVNLFIAKMFNKSAYISNSLFFMICGYFHIKKFKLNLKSVIWKTCFYGFLLGFAGRIAQLFGNNDFDNKKLNTLMFNPASSRIYWFISTYIIVILFSLELNKFLNNLTKIGYIIYLILFYIIWYFISYCYNGNYFKLKFGIFFYSLGGYLKLFPKKKKLYKILFFLIVGIIGFIFTMRLDFLLKILKSTKNYIFLIGIPLASYGFFNFFILLDIGSINIINMFGRTVYAVYLLHESYISRKIIWKYITNIKERYVQKNFPLIFVVTVFGTFFSCSFIEILQQKFIENNAFKLLDKIFIFFKKHFTDNYKQIGVKENIEFEKFIEV
jgi:hypothetical protein